MAAFAPANLAAVALAVFGIGLIVAAFVGAGLGTLGLGVGIVLVVAGLITAGLHSLTRHGAPTRPEDA